MPYEEENLDSDGITYNSGRNFCIYTSKRAYATEARAWEVAEHQESEGAPKLEVYRCGGCGFYHLARRG